MALDLETLLAPVSEEQPTGEDLSYDNERAELELAFEQGSDDPDAEGAPEREWRSVLKLIENQFARTKDVGLAVYLARAGAESGDLETVELGAQVLAGLFELYWEGVHPQLEELGLQGRKAPCDALANRKAFLAPFERTVLISHPRLGRFSGMDLERFRTEGASADGYGMFRAALEEIGAEGLQSALDRLDAIEAAFKRADKVFTAEAAGEVSPNFGPTYATLASLKQGVRAFLPGDEEGGGGDGGDGGADAGAGGGGSGGGGGGGRSLSGAINSRDEVIRALGLVADYYRNREPGHPMPMLMARATEWVTMDFLTLMKAIAPDGVSQAGMVLTNRPTEDEAY